MRWLAFLVLSLALVAAGCGGSSNEAAATTEPTTTETTRTESTTTSETSSDETSTEASGGAAGAFNWTSDDCQSMVKAFVGLSAAVGAASSGQDVSPEVETFAKYVDEVPDEIQADVKTIAGAYKDFLAKLKDLGYVAGQVPTADQIQQLEEASKSMGDPAVQAASERLNTWTTKNCM